MVSCDSRRRIAWCSFYFFYQPQFVPSNARCSRVDSVSCDNEDYNVKRGLYCLFVRNAARTVHVIYPFLKSSVVK